MMKKQMYLLLACLATTVQAFAGGCFDDCYNDCCFDSVFTLDLGGGVREDKIRWKSFLPGIETKTKWHDVQSGIIDGTARFLACETYLVRFDFDYGWIYNNGRQNLKSYNIDLVDSVLLSDLSSRTKGNVYDLSGALGYQFNWCSYQYAFTPLVGYSYNYQRLKNNSYNDRIDPENTAFENVDNRYTYRWRGPWVGFAAAFQPTCEWQIFVEYAYHWSRLKSSVNENFLLGEADGSLKAKKAHGNEVTVGTSYVFCDCWSLGLKFNYKEFTAKKGRVSNSESCASVRGFNWTQYNGTIDLGYTF